MERQTKGAMSVTKMSGRSVDINTHRGAPQFGGLFHSGLTSAQARGQVSIRRPEALSPTGVASHV